MTHHIQVINNYLQSPINGFINVLRNFGKAVMESRMRSAMAIIKDDLMKHRAYRETYNELAKMSDKELRDIGITRGMIHHIALEATYGPQD